MLSTEQQQEQDFYLSPNEDSLVDKVCGKPQLYCHSDDHSRVQLIVVLKQNMRRDTPI